MNGAKGVEHSVTTRDEPDLSIRITKTEWLAKSKSKDKAAKAKAKGKLKRKSKRKSKSKAKSKATRKAKVKGTANSKSKPREDQVPNTPSCNVDLDWVVDALGFGSPERSDLVLQGLELVDLDSALADDENWGVWAEGQVATQWGLEQGVAVMDGLSTMSPTVVECGDDDSEGDAVDWGPWTRARVEPVGHGNSEDVQVLPDAEGRVSYEALRAELQDLAGLVDFATSDASPGQVIEQHVLLACKHVDTLYEPLAMAEETMQQIDTKGVAGQLLQETGRLLDECTDAALAKAKVMQLSDTDKLQLLEARKRRIAALSVAEQEVFRQVEEANKVKQVCSRLGDLQEELTESLGSPPSTVAADEFVPATVEELKQLVSASEEARKRAAALRPVIRDRARELYAALEELHKVSEHVTDQLASTFRLPHDANLTVAVPEALHHNLESRLRRSIQLHADLAEPAATTRQRTAELRHMSTAVQHSIADAGCLSVMEEDLVQKRHALADKEDELEDLQTKLRRLKRRNRLTAEEAIKREARIAEQQHMVAVLHGELEGLQADIEQMAARRMPEAVQVLAVQHDQQQLPEVLRMLQPTGLYRNRSLAADYEEVADVQVTSQRFQMRVVRSVGSDEVKVLKAFPADMFKQIRNEVVNVARVEHPNVLRPELVFMDAGGALVWVQYPYVAHGSLDRWLEDECVGSVELLSRDGYELLRGVFREVLDGVVHLHANGVVHNDIKSANVLMGDGVVPHLCGFELSNSMEVSGTRGLGSMTVRGLTVSYAAPENKRSTEKSDMYSVGRLMYDTLLHEWLAQWQGAAAASPAAMMRAHLPPGYDPRTHTWAFPDGVHPAFRDLVERLLNEVPALRPSAEQARAHPFFTQRLFADEEEAVPALSIQLDVTEALYERQYWLTDGSDVILRRVPLDRSSYEASQVVTLFRARGCPLREVVSIERVENAQLLRRFALRKHELEEKYGAAVDEQLVFHGTKSHVVDSIVEQGFDMRLNGANGTALGKGNYFARDSSYSADAFNERFSPADAHGVKWMFVARILVGETVLGHGGLRRAERPEGTLVDTAVDDEEDPSIYVTFDNGQAMPVYVIGFR